MAFLKVFVIMLVLMSGCYAPDISDCSVTCTTNDECVGDQVCTTHGLCAGSPTACDDNELVDGGSTPRMIALQVAVDGGGKVAIADGPVCEPTGGSMGSSCVLMVPAGPLVIQAIAGEKPFEKWTSIVCAGQSARCEVTLQLSSTVSAKFH
jgi:hypothetical protein